MKYDKETIARIVNLKLQGYNSRIIAKELGISKSGVNYAYNRWQKEGCTILYKPEDVALKYLSTQQASPARILLLDIETAPDIAATFGRFKQNIGVDNVVREGGWIISAAWQWLGENTIYCTAVTPEEARNSDDSGVVAELYELLEQCDAVVAHNGEKFDIPVIKARLTVNNFPEPKKVKVIDTLKIAKQMRFQSNKLDALGKVLKEARKQEHEGISLWIDCMRGDEDALKRMLEYNVQDVSLLEKVYNRIKHMDSKPVNLGLFYDDNEHRCPVCGSSDVEYTGNSVYTQVSEFKEVQCGDCGHRSRERKAINSKEKRSSLLT